MNSQLCTYCNTSNGIVREHVIPASYLGNRRYDSDAQWIVEGCTTCNQLAGSSVFFSIPEKAAHIRARYLTYYKKVLNVPIWSPEELKSVSYRLRSGINEKLIARTLVERRLAHLQYISEQPLDYLRPKWVYDLMLAWQRSIQEEKAALKNKRPPKLANTSNLVGGGERRI